MHLPQHNPERWFIDEVLPHGPALRAWLLSRYPAIADVDDVVQESFARVLRAQAAAPIGAPKAFLFSTARNLALDQLRRRQVVTIDSVAEIESLSVSDGAPTAADTAAHHQELQLLTQAIQSLPERCRQVLTLRKIYGLSQKEIAAQLGISEHTVEAQVGNGVRRCSEFLARRGLP